MLLDISFARQPAADGVVNVSHGCANVSPADADWLMSVTHVGDLVTVTGTGPIVAVAPTAGRRARPGAT